MHTYHENQTHGTPLFPLQVYSHYDRGGFFFVSQHWHEEFEWIYAEYGPLRLTTRETCVSLNPGEFCFINSGELHEIRSQGESLHHAVVFHPGLLDFALYDVCQHEFIRPVTGKTLRFPTLARFLPPETENRIRSHLLEIVRLYRESSAGASLSIRIHLLHVVESLFQAGAFRENTQPQKDRDCLDKLKRVIEYIHQNYAGPIPLETLARLCFMSPNYFCRFFKQQMGRTPVAFINEYRIEKACEMLAESALPISDISLSAGFGNFSYFIRKFREYKGVTPKTYRSNLLHNQEKSSLSENYLQ